MNGKKVLIGITGSIAAYKIPMLVRLLVKQGAEVKVVMTPSAADFVSPLVLSTLSKNEVLVELSAQHTWSNHVMLGRWADVMLIAPTSANTLAKMAHGLCDNLLLAVYLSATCPVMIAPAMDEDMYHHPAVTKNMALLNEYGHTIIPSEHGELASGLVGYGRMAEPETLMDALSNFFSSKKKLKHKKALVTAGPTYENIDPVRFIGNHSSGKMGIALAEALAEQGCEVELVLGPSAEKTTHPGIHTTRVRSAQDMFDACVRWFPSMDIAIMSAAVADYTPQVVAEDKIKKQEAGMTLTLTKTKDILKHLGTIKTNQQLLVGFALESKDERAYALGKLTSKNADMIVLNSVRDEGAGFGFDTNKVTIFDKEGNEHTTALKTKKEIARDIVNQIIRQLI